MIKGIVITTAEILVAKLLVPEIISAISKPSSTKSKRINSVRMILFDIIFKVNVF